MRATTVTTVTAAKSVTAVTAVTALTPEHEGDRQEATEESEQRRTGDARVRDAAVEIIAELVPERQEARLRIVDTCVTGVTDV